MTGHCSKCGSEFYNDRNGGWQPFCHRCIRKDTDRRNDEWRAFQIDQDRKYGPR